MSGILYVTPAQVLAAKLAVELSEEDGEEPDEAVRAIASAQVVADVSQSAADIRDAGPGGESTNLGAQVVFGIQNLSDDALRDFVVEFFQQVKREDEALAEEMDREASALRAAHEDILVRATHEARAVLAAEKVVRDQAMHARFVHESLASFLRTRLTGVKNAQGELFNELDSDTIRDAVSEPLATVEGFEQVPPEDVTYSSGPEPPSEPTGREGESGTDESEARPEGAWTDAMPTEAAEEMPTDEDQELRRRR